jgi:hypothetical protein
MKQQINVILAIASLLSILLLPTTSKAGSWDYICMPHDSSTGNGPCTDSEGNCDDGAACHWIRHDPRCEYHYIYTVGNCSKDQDCGSVTFEADAWCDAYDGCNCDS